MSGSKAHPSSTSQDSLRAILKTPCPPYLTNGTRSTGGGTRGPEQQRIDHEVEESTTTAGAHPVPPALTAAGELERQTCSPAVKENGTIRLLACLLSAF